MKMSKNDFRAEVERLFSFAHQNRKAKMKTMNIDIGTRWETAGKYSAICTVSDILKTYNSAGNLIRIEYVSQHSSALGGTTESIDNQTTVARGIARLAGQLA